MKFGGEFRLIRGYSQLPGYDAGNFAFDQTFTGANPLPDPNLVRQCAGVVSCSALRKAATSRSRASPRARNSLFSLFMQNDIRLTDKLKVNLGLRWDYLGPLTDRFNEFSRGFASTTLNPISPSNFPVYGGVLFSGREWQPARYLRLLRGVTSGPRFGAAYQLTQHTVLRGGYALIYGQTFYDPGNAPRLYAAD